jgi:hypothetical protein
MRGFVQDLPKAELHVHLEGSIEPATLSELDPSLTPEAIQALYGYDSFLGFLGSYEQVVRRLRAPDDFSLITRRLLERLHSENVRYAEINLSVGVMLWRKQDVAPIFEAVNAEARRSPVEVRWIFDAVRQFAVSDAMRVAELAAERMGEGVGNCIWRRTRANRPARKPFGPVCVWAPNASATASARRTTRRSSATCATTTFRWKFRSRATWPPAWFHRSTRIPCGGCSTPACPSC